MEDMMASFDWRLYGEHTVAYLLTEPEVRGCASGFFKKKITVGPSEAAAIIRDGMIEDIVTQDKVTTSGFLDGLKGWFGGGKPDIQLMYADITPFDVGFDVQGITRDKEALNGEAMLRVHVDLNNAAGLHGLLKGKKGLAREDVLNAVNQELGARVFAAGIASHDAADFRGNNALLDQIENQARGELINTLSTWGLSLDRLVINWGLTEQDQADIAAKREEREGAIREFEHEREIREREREQEIRRIELANLQELRVAEEEGDQELLDIALQGDLRRQAMEGGGRLDTAKIGQQIERINLEIQREQVDLDLWTEQKRQSMEQERKDREEERERQRKDRDAERERQKEREIHDQTMSEFELIQQKKQERQQQALDAQQAQMETQAQAQQAQMETQTQAQQDLLSKALDKGITDSSMMSEFLRQQTMQKAVDRSDNVAESASQAEAARHNIETYKEAEDRERRHQVDMTQQAASMMEASKQQPGSTIVTGAGTPQGGATNVNVVSGQPQGQAVPQTPASGKNCPSCGGEVQESWKVCPACGNALSAGPVCPSCGGEIQEGWKACPACGNALSAGPVCPSCGGEIQEGWKACPACGSKLGPTTCPQCNAEVQEDWKACPACGSKL
jgi:hypothetical protein